MRASGRCCWKRRRTQIESNFGKNVPTTDQRSHRIVAFIASAHAVEQNTAVQVDTAPIEEPPLPRPKPLLPHLTGNNPAVLISAFRHQHGEESVTISPALTRIAQEQANAMAARDSLDHNALAPFSSRIGRSGFSRTAENIAYGHTDFASTLEQWTNSNPRGCWRAINKRRALLQWLGRTLFTRCKCLQSADC